MRTILQKAAERGTADYGWLKPNFYFSFGQYYNPEKVHFGMLRVLNDDFIAGGGKFQTHPHDNMEIVTIPFTGALEHRDSTFPSEDLFECVIRIDITLVLSVL